MADVWDTNTPESWRKELTNIGWKVERHPNGNVSFWEIRGPCPRCRDEMWVETGPGFPLGLTVAEPADSTANSEAVWAVCNCKQKHDGRPETRKTGCGQAGEIPGPAQSDAVAAINEEVANG